MPLFTNLAWASTIRTNLKKIHSQQKHAIRIIFRKYIYFQILKNFCTEQCKSIKYFE